MKSTFGWIRSHRFVVSVIALVAFALIGSVIFLNQSSQEYYRTHIPETYGGRAYLERLGFDPQAPKDVVVVDDGFSARANTVYFKPGSLAKQDPTKEQSKTVELIYVDESGKPHQLSVDRDKIAVTSAPTSSVRFMMTDEFMQGGELYLSQIFPFAANTRYRDLAEAPGVSITETQLWKWIEGKGISGLLQSWFVNRVELALSATDEIRLRF